MFSLYHRGGGNASVGYKFADSSKPAILTAMTPKKIFLTESGQAKNWTSAWFNRPMEQVGLSAVSQAGIERTSS